MRTPEPRGPAPDPDARAVVWAAGSPAGRRSRLATHPVLRWTALVALASLAVFVLAYAVHAYVVVTPPANAPVAPLWLPEQLPADGGTHRHPSWPARTASSASGDDRSLERSARGHGADDGPEGTDDRSGR